MLCENIFKTLSNRKSKGAAILTEDSPVPCHLSHVLIHIFFLKLWSFSVKGLLSTGPTPLISYFFLLPVSGVWVHWNFNTVCIPWDFGLMMIMIFLLLPHPSSPTPPPLISSTCSSSCSSYFKFLSGKRLTVKSFLN